MKLGLDPDLVAEVVNGSTGKSYASEVFVPNIPKGEFESGYPMKAAYKDMICAATSSAEQRIPLPVLAAATATYQQALQQGHGKLDKGAMILPNEKLLQVEFRMEDFHAAGGVGAVLREPKPLLHLDTIDIEGVTLAERLAASLDWINRSVIPSADDPVSEVGGLIALKRSLAPDGAIFKRAAASPELFEIEGRAVVFTGLEDLSRRIDDPDLDVKADDILVLQNARPEGATMPEAGYLPIPEKLARQGVKDMVRISDARMSRTAFGTIVLHVAPEAAIGGRLGAVRTGDCIRLSVANKRIALPVDDIEIAQPLASHRQPSVPKRGYEALYRRSVLQAPHGCDFDFLVGDVEGGQDNQSETC
ncbi:hypothetical protein CWO90_19315 [Bradyrhizobium sp. Leo121]|nr:hypothetical protein CWO90_19315 [Bradyrhizobium sp. Leo121]